jgi:hypothetical protein
VQRRETQVPKRLTGGLDSGYKLFLTSPSGLLYLGVPEDIGSGFCWVL